MSLVAADACDVAEQCTGTTASCPTDVKNTCELTGLKWYDVNANGTFDTDEADQYERPKRKKPCEEGWRNDRQDTATTRALPAAMIATPSAVGMPDMISLYA